MAAFSGKISLKEAKLKAAKYCAYQERTQQQVRDKLYGLGCTSDETEEIISALIIDGFINEERFALTFAGGKFGLKKWGRIKIKYQLSALNISEYCINKALESIDESEYSLTLDGLVAKKWNEIKEKSHPNPAQKIINFAMQKGYEVDLIKESIERQKLFLK